ncbi:hypothetical protein Psyaliredsea_25780 [Psychrobacter alimentarius]
MFGSAKFLALFLLAAIGGNLLNSYVTWQGILDGNGQAGLSAGASGGIMGIGAALLVAAFFKISVNGLMLNLRSLLFIMGINLVYGFAVPGIDNAGHIGGAVTGLIIASAFAIAYRRRMVITQQNMPISQHPYPVNEPSPYRAHDQDTYQTHYIDQASDVDMSYPSDHNAEFDTSTLETNFSTVHNTAISHETQAKPSLFWTLLPWIVMLLISVGFVWWWQDIHYQIVEVLKTIE